jgi:hypothetical protein
MSQPSALEPVKSAAAASRHCRRVSVTVAAAASPSHCCCMLQLELRLGVRVLAAPFSPLFPILPRARLLAGASPLHLAVARLPWQSVLPLKPVDAFHSLLAFSQAKPELNL